MRKLFLLSIIMASSVLAWAGDVIVSSPNGGLKVTISDAVAVVNMVASQQ